MPDYGPLLDFCLMNREADRLAFETAKHSPFLFLLSHVDNPPVEPWQPLLFGGLSNHSLIQDTPVVIPDAPPHIEP